MGIILSRVGFDRVKLPRSGQILIIRLPGGRRLSKGYECDAEAASLKPSVFGGPAVRISFAPAGSQVRTCLSREFAFLGREAGVFRGCAGRGERRGRQRRAGRGNIGPTGGKYLCRAIFQYRAAGDVGSLTDGGGFEFGSGSGKTERGPLIVPGERQT